MPGVALGMAFAVVWRAAPRPLTLSFLLHTASGVSVAAQLFVSPKTVEHRLGNIYKKLEVRSRTELARIVTGQLEAEAA